MCDGVEATEAFAADPDPDPIDTCPTAYEQAMLIRVSLADEEPSMRRGPVDGPRARRCGRRLARTRDGPLHAAAALVRDPVSGTLGVGVNGRRLRVRSAPDLAPARGRNVPASAGSPASGCPSLLARDRLFDRALPAPGVA